MIEEPPTLTIKDKFTRPTQEQIQAFQSTPTGFVVDAMDGSGALTSNVRPLYSDRGKQASIAGPALTVDTGPADILALLASLAFIQPGDVVVSAFSGYQRCAACGDRVAGMIKNNQASGFITDGPMRDYPGVEALKLPVWCSGINPNSPASQGPGSVGLPISIGNVQVSSGDMIVADQDGVVVVPFRLIDSVIDRLKRIQELEKELDQEVEDGLKVPQAIKELLASDQVRFID